MRCEVIIDRDTEERAVIYAKERTQRINEIERFISKDVADIVGYRGKSAVMLSPDEVYCFSVEGGYVWAVMEKERLLVRMRLYELEQVLGEEFMKINQSAIVNVRQIARFDAHITGSLAVVLKNGYRDFISRRQMKSVKERIKF